jgi:hypothetical protein
MRLITGGSGWHACARLLTMVNDLFFLRDNLMTLEQNSYRKDLHENKITPKSYCNPRSMPARRTCRWRGRRRFSTDAWIGRRPMAHGLSSNLETRRSSIRRCQPPPGPDLPPGLRRARTGSAAPDSGRLMTTISYVRTCWTPTLTRA